MTEEIQFTKSQRGECAGCGVPIGAEDNWGCVRQNVPIAGLPLTVLIHQHLHVKCAHPKIVKWWVLRDLGRSRLGAN